MIPPREAAQFNIYKSHQFISDKGTIGKEGEWDGWNYGIDAPNSNTHQGGHATARFLEGFLECFLTVSILEGFLEGACKGFQ